MIVQGTVSTVSNPQYLKTDKNQIINETAIRWVLKVDECMKICTRANGCGVDSNTHNVCKNITPRTYNYLNRFFPSEE